MGTLRFLSDVKKWKGVRVLLRIDGNVPSGPGGITDTYRLEAVVPTLKYLHSAGARVVIISHLEERGTKKSLAPVADYFSAFVPLRFFAGDVRSASKVTLADGEVLFLENIRYDAREEQNDTTYAKELAQLGTLFVNDAFGAMHREHASIVGVPRLLPSVGGLLLQKEVKNLSRLFKPQHPATAIVGGLKFQTKAPLIEKFLSTFDSVFVVGALANSFYKARGFEIGISSVDADFASVKPLLKHPKIVVPEDVVVDRGGEQYVVPASGVLAGEKIVDAGPSFVQTLSRSITNSACVLWNGPLGIYESGYGEATTATARALGESRSFRVVGGGDTVAAIRSAGLTHQLDFISTGGGAMLDFLAKETLPGIRALEQSADLFPHLG